MLKKGVFRAKTGIVKEGVQINFYHDDEHEDPPDLVDHMLLHKYNLDLQSQYDSDGSEENGDKDGIDTSSTGK